MSIRRAASVNSGREQSYNIRSKSSSESTGEIGIKRHKANELDLNLMMQEGMEELEELYSVFGRANRNNRKTSEEFSTDFIHTILDDNADNKLEQLIVKIKQVDTDVSLINLAREFFQSEIDIWLVFQEMLKSRKLSQSKKNKINNELNELLKFGEAKKILSGANVSSIAKTFSQYGDTELDAFSLRNSYLLFIEMDMPASFLYQSWIDEFGFENRTRVLTFILHALIADIKSLQPGIHASEFGPLRSKLSDARVLNTVEVLLSEKLRSMKFFPELNNDIEDFDKEIFSLYFLGLTEYPKFQQKLKDFTVKFLHKLIIRHRAEFYQILKHIYDSTPEFIYADESFKEKLSDFMLLVMKEISDKEKVTGIWSEYHKY